MHKRLFLLSVATLFTFYVFSWVVNKRYLAKLDFDLMVKIQDRVPPGLNEQFLMFSFLGDVALILPALVVILILHRKLLGYFTLFFFILAHFFELYGKSVVEQTSPPVMFFRQRAPAFFPDWHAFAGFSYPSGHSLRAVFLYIIVIFVIAKSKLLGRPAKNLLYLALTAGVGAMLVSRVSLGEHWFTDVVGGSLLGTSFALLSLVFL